MGGSMPPEPLRYEDIPLGLVCTAVDEYEVSRDEIVEFASRFDPYPFHLHEAGGAASDFGGLVAPGLLVISVSTLLSHREVPRTAAAIGLGIDELRLLRPVRPGDRLRQATEVIERRRSRSRPDRGIVRGRRTVRNQDDVAVMTCVVTWMVERAPDAGPCRSEGPAAPVG
jgi:acyl dehydratase